ncbi:hypothetical protein JCM10212_001233 [Sporobolomyces blumeae]
MATQDVDYYALLGLDQTATLQEIKTAYRKRSLKVHPDRNPDNPEAARLFHELRLAADLLSDPTQRASYDALVAARQAKLARFSALDSKRKAMAHDLEAREREFKRQKGHEDDERARKRHEVERLKEEGRRMRRERDEQNRKNVVGLAGDARQGAQEGQAQQAQRGKTDDVGRDGIVDLGPLDKTLKVKWQKSLHPLLTSPKAVVSYLERQVAPLALDVESIVLSSKTLAKGTKGKFGSGVVSFKTLSAAVRVVKARGKSNEDGEWQGFAVEWAAGHAPEALGDDPAVQPRPSTTSETSRPTSPLARPPSPPPSTAPNPLSASASVDSNEDEILARLRQREREKVMEEMRRQDEAEAAGE